MGVVKVALVLLLVLAPVPVVPVAMGDDEPPTRPVCKLGGGMSVGVWVVGYGCESEHADVNVCARVHV